MRKYTEFDTGFQKAFQQPVQNSSGNMIGSPEVG